MSRPLQGQPKPRDVTVTKTVSLPNPSVHKFIQHYSRWATDKTLLPGACLRKRGKQPFVVLMEAQHFLLDTAEKPGTVPVYTKQWPRLTTMSAIHPPMALKCIPFNIEDRIPSMPSAERITGGAQEGVKVQISAPTCGLQPAKRKVKRGEIKLEAKIVWGWESKRNLQSQVQFNCTGSKGDGEGRKGGGGVGGDGEGLWCQPVLVGSKRKIG